MKGRITVLKSVSKALRQEAKQDKSGAEFAKKLPRRSTNTTTRSPPLHFLLSAPSHAPGSQQSRSAAVAKACMFWFLFIVIVDSGEIDEPLLRSIGRAAVRATCPPRGMRRPLCLR